MSALNRMIIKDFTIMFFMFLLFFALFFELIDLFSNLWRYLNNDVSVLQMGMIAFYYLPKCLSFSLPISLLFSVSYTLGTYYANNELIAVFSSGIPLIRFVLPLLVLGMGLSFFTFYFDEYVVIDSYKKKNELSSRFLKTRTIQANRSWTMAVSSNNRFVYYADYYRDATKSLDKVTIIERDKDNNFIKAYYADKAVWEDNQWKLYHCRIFTYGPKSKELVQTLYDTYTSADLVEPPTSFRQDIRDVEEMKINTAKDWILGKRRAGLPYKKSLTEYFRRFSFTLTPFIVTLISSSIGGWFKKNILLMSLLMSLSIVVAYYVIEMIMGLFAEKGLLSPLVGAWFPVLLFLAVGFILFRFART